MNNELGNTQLINLNNKYFQSNSHTSYQLQNKRKSIAKPLLSTKPKIEVESYSTLHIKEQSNKSSYSNIKNNTLLSLDSYFKPTSLQFDKEKLTTYKEGYYTYLNKLNIKQRIRLVSNKKYNFKFHVEIFPRLYANKSQKNISFKGIKDKLRINPSIELAKINNTNQSNKNNIKKCNENYKLDEMKPSNNNMRKVHITTLNGSLTHGRFCKKALSLQSLKKSSTSNSHHGNNLSSSLPRSIHNRKVYIHNAREDEIKFKENWGSFYTNSTITNNSPLFQINPRIAYNDIIKDRSALCLMFQDNLDNKHLKIT